MGAFATCRYVRFGRYYKPFVAQSVFLCNHRSLTNSLPIWPIGREAALIPSATLPLLKHFASSREKDNTASNLRDAFEFSFRDIGQMIEDAENAKYEQSVARDLTTESTILQQSVEKAAQQAAINLSGDTAAAYVDPSPTSPVLSFDTNTTETKKQRKIWRFKEMLHFIYTLRVSSRESQGELSNSNWTHFPSAFIQSLPLLTPSQLSLLLNRLWVEKMDFHPIFEQCVKIIMLQREKFSAPLLSKIIYTLSRSHYTNGNVWKVLESCFIQGLSITIPNGYILASNAFAIGVKDIANVVWAFSGIPSYYNVFDFCKSILLEHLQGPKRQNGQTIVCSPRDVALIISSFTNNKILDEAFFCFLYNSLDGVAKATMNGEDLLRITEGCVLANVKEIAIYLDLQHFAIQSYKALRFYQINGVLFYLQFTGLTNTHLLYLWTLSFAESKAWISPSDLVRCFFIMSSARVSLDLHVSAALIEIAESALDAMSLETFICILHLTANTLRSICNTIGGGSSLYFERNIYLFYRKLLTISSHFRYKLLLGPSQPNTQMIRKALLQQCCLTTAVEPFEYFPEKQNLQIKCFEAMINFVLEIPGAFADFHVFDMEYIFQSLAFLQLNSQESCALVNSFAAQCMHTLKTLQFPCSSNNPLLPLDWVASYCCWSSLRLLLSELQLINEETKVSLDAFLMQSLQMLPIASILMLIQSFLLDSSVIHSPDSALAPKLLILFDELSSRYSDATYVPLRSHTLLLQIAMLYIMHASDAAHHLCHSVGYNECLNTETSIYAKFVKFFENNSLIDYVADSKQFFEFSWHVLEKCSNLAETSRLLPIPIPYDAFTAPVFASRYKDEWRERWIERMGCVHTDRSNWKWAEWAEDYLESNADTLPAKWGTSAQVNQCHIITVPEASIGPFTVDYLLSVPATREFT